MLRYAIDIIFIFQNLKLIHVSQRPLNADEARRWNSPAPTSAWPERATGMAPGALKHLPGDRREYFDAPSNAWEVFQTLAEECRRREIEPTLSMLRNALLEKPSSEENSVAQERMRGMHELHRRPLENRKWRPRCCCLLCLTQKTKTTTML